MSMRKNTNSFVSLLETRKDYKSFFMIRTRNVEFDLTLKKVSEPHFSLYRRIVEKTTFIYQNGLIVGSSNLIEICQRPEGCNLTVTVLGSQASGICLDQRIGKGSVHLAK